MSKQRAHHTQPSDGESEKGNLLVQSEGLTKKGGMGEEKERLRVK
jgi:hypothetical protein